MQKMVFPKDELSKLREQLMNIDRLSIDQNGISHSFLETELESGELRINGNSFGLLHLAIKILDVATKDFIGAHAHLDEAELNGKCDMPVVFALKNADWEQGD